MRYYEFVSLYSKTKSQSVPGIQEQGSRARLLLWARRALVGFAGDDESRAQKQGRKGTKATNSGKSTLFADGESVQPAPRNYPSTATADSAVSLVRVGDRDSSGSPRASRNGTRSRTTRKKVLATSTSPQEQFIVFDKNEKFLGRDRGVRRRFREEICVTKAKINNDNWAEVQMQIN